MISVLFVCLGNICRSPMAEAVMRHQVEEAELSTHIQIDSAGTGDWHIGHSPHEGTRQMLDQVRISYAGMKARQVEENDFTNFTYIVCMDENNERNVMAWKGAHDRTAEVLRFMSLLPEEPITDVPDPYYTGNFDEVYRLVSEGCKQLLAKIVREHHLSV
ncbi:low molecular weight protein-tyrosine-phosphatase [Paenibacillus sp. UMB4589-SE434]|uniref:low molecular weight protein-tyrosine-phosphatase n=1 Tax=Paenibacillus sp. UMB4589-SE434 TaxID=3046314 RepID=UPI00254D9E5C|nr:low molecular weight protein-tyrosine-phosphatase [Paenibacillus sp. UMB4589-SE434]MDK8180363.1 low molecular weight protein-tyrosine-phosphatase [Paenibacillus sp. UMB4589-SE434]